MTIAKKISGFMEQSSWIRKMFEQGILLKKEHGEENVFDLSLGNPVVEPPKELMDAMKAAVNDTAPGLHRYMPNAGLPDVRAAIARSLTPECKVELSGDHVVIVCGAAGGLNITLKTLLDPGDEVIVFTPYFVEYMFYADNHGGKMVAAPTKDDFTIDIGAFEKTVTAKTKMVIINSPNNPTGVVYTRSALKELADVLRKKSAATGQAIYLISDDPYKKIVYDGVETPNIFEFYEDSVYITSHSKDLAVPGERIGFVVVHPNCRDQKNLMDGLIFCNRVLGFINAPALIQRAVKDIQHVAVDIEPYRKKRDLLYKELTRIGYETVKPQGAFYFFPKSPLEDEVEFVRILAGKKVLAVPGRGFGSPGYFRLSYAVHDRVVEGAIRGLEAAFQEATGKG